MMTREEWDKLTPDEQWTQFQTHEAPKWHWVVAQSESVPPDAWAASVYFDGTLWCKFEGGNKQTYHDGQWQ